MKNNLSLLKVYKKPDIKSEIVTQLLYGETFKKIKKKGSWVKIKNNFDNYKGFIKYKKFPQNEINTHKIYSLFANLYSAPKNKKKIKKKLSFGSRIKIEDQKNDFYRFGKLWIKKKT